MRPLLLLIALPGCCFADCALPGATLVLQHTSGAPVASASLRLLRDGEVIAMATCGPDQRPCEAAFLAVEEPGDYAVEITVGDETIDGPTFVVTREDVRDTCCGGFFGTFEVEIPDPA